MKEDSVLFVFYNLSKNNYWEYNRMPEDWRWTGEGFTRPFSPNKNRKKSEKNSLFENEEQFNGPIKTINNMKEYLNEFFTNLKNNNKIDDFKISDFYEP